MATKKKKKHEPVTYDEVFSYLVHKKYLCFGDARKRAIRIKAAMFFVEDGVLFTRSDFDNASQVKSQKEARRWIRDSETKNQIIQSCHQGLEVISDYCKAPPDIANGNHKRTGISQATITTTVKYDCHTGYNFTATTMSTCVANESSHGNWTQPPTCTVISTLPQTTQSVTSNLPVEASHCPALLDPAFKTIPRTPVHGIATVVCNDSRYISGPPRIVCLSEGRWNIQPIYEDIDECSEETHNCAHTCVNTKPGYTCYYNVSVGCYVPTSSTTKQVALSTTIGSVLGSFLAGVLSTALVFYILKKKQSSSTKCTCVTGTEVNSTPNVGCKSVEMTDTAMTSSEAYGHVAVGEQPQYECINPIQ